MRSVAGSELQVALGRRFDLGHAAGRRAERPDGDVRRLDAERGERRADLAAMVRPVVERLSQANAAGRMRRRSVVVVDRDDVVGVLAGGEQRQPLLPVALRLVAERREISGVLVDRVGALRRSAGGGTSNRRPPCAAASR